MPLTFPVYALPLFAGALILGCTHADSMDKKDSEISSTTGDGVAATTSAGSINRQPPTATPVYKVQVVHSYPHDPQAFTQGLLYQGGVLYEGTGLEGRSSIRKVDLETGRVLKAKPIDNSIFGEGITIWKNNLIEITWKSKLGFVYDVETFSRKKSFKYGTEGWGLTHDDAHLIMSDGSSKLYFWDPETFKETGSVEVKDQGIPVSMLNELEVIKGEIYANVWQTDRIARIDPKSGEVKAWIDASGLLTPEERANTDVLNGIAYDEKGGRLFLTGKLWPKLFEVKLIKS